MTIQQWQTFLLWCTVINAVCLLIWIGFYLCGRGLIYKMHGRIFKLSPDRFDAIHYTGMAIYKCAIILFNLVPYVALRIVAG